MIIDTDISSHSTYKYSYDWTLVSAFICESHNKSCTKNSTLLAQYGAVERSKDSVYMAILFVYS